jgi:hypothetical protein
MVAQFNVQVSLRHSETGNVVLCLSLEHGENHRITQYVDDILGKRGVASPHELVLPILDRSPVTRSPFGHGRKRKHTPSIQYPHHDPLTVMLRISNAPKLP